MNRAKEDQPSEVLVLGPTGAIEERRTFGEDPWPRESPCNDRRGAVVPVLLVSRASRASACARRRRRRVDARHRRARRRVARAELDGVPLLRARYGRNRPNTGTARPRRGGATGTRRGAARCRTTASLTATRSRGVNGAGSSRATASIETRPSAPSSGALTDPQAVAVRIARSRGRVPSRCRGRAYRTRAAIASRSSSTNT